jgi:hypothetical protein
MHSAPCSVLLLHTCIGLPQLQLPANPWHMRCSLQLVGEPSISSLDVSCRLYSFPGAYHPFSPH